MNEQTSQSIQGHIDNFDDDYDSKHEVVIKSQIYPHLLNVEDLK